MQNDKPRPPLSLLVAILFALIATLHIGSALLGRPLFRASHLGPALKYASGSINLLRPIIPGFNATETPTALELPLWQAAAALAFKCARSTWYGWANVTSLLLFATALWPFFQLAREYQSERSAWWATAFLLAQPIIILAAGEASTDGLSLVASLWFLFFAHRMVRSCNPLWWLPTTLFATLSALLKLPFFMTAGLCSIWMLIALPRPTRRAWLLLASAGLVAALLFALWTKYTNSLAAQAIYPYQDLRLAESPHMVFWFFGDLRYRLNPAHWIKGTWRLLHATLGSLPLIALAVAGWVRPGNPLPKFWLGGALATTLVFTHLVLEHWHYYLMCSPAIALLCGIALERWEPFWAQEMPRQWFRLALVALVLVFSSIEGFVAMKIAINYDDFKTRLSHIIQDHTNPHDKVIVFDPDDWGGEILFRSGRSGLCVYSLETLIGGGASKGLFQLLASEQDLKKLQAMGYDRLILLSESPVRYAVQAANPGSKRQRRFYPAKISPTVDSWPVIYQSEDILIKQIP